MLLYTEMQCTHLLPLGQYIEIQCNHILSLRQCVLLYIEIQCNYILPYSERCYDMIDFIVPNIKIENKAYHSVETIVK